MQNFSSKVRNELLRALRNFRYERNEQGLFIAGANLQFGGAFGSAVDGGPISYGHNAFANEGLNVLLDAFFSQGTQPVGFYLAPFSNNLAPTNALTAATFTSTQGEYTGYTQTARPQWVSNGAAANQTKSNSAAPGSVTIGASAATVYGAALIASASAKSATTGTMAAAGLFGSANVLNPGSTLTMEYTLTATAT